MYRASALFTERSVGRRRGRYTNDKYRPRYLWRVRRNSRWLPLAICALGLLLWTTFPTVTKELNIVPIPRIPAGSLSVQEFYEQYGDRTVIIEGGVRHHPAFQLGFEGLKELCGGGTLDTALYSSDVEDELLRIRDGGPMFLRDYIDQYLTGHTKGDPRVLASTLSLPVMCPALELQTPFPSYVSSALQGLDEVRNSSDGKQHRLLASQPEIFIGPQGTKITIHMDNYLVPFWMAVYAGKKTFRTIPYEDSIKHMPYYTGVRNAQPNRFEKTVLSKWPWTFQKKQLEIWDPDLETFPEVTKVRVYEGTVNAGDWIYLPPATLHAVYNTEDTWAVSVNSLPPPTFSKFVDICADNHFIMGCTRILEGIEECNDLQTKEGLKNCLADSDLVHSIQKEYDEGPREKYLHEYASYDGFEPWCEAVCAHVNDLYSLTSFRTVFDTSKGGKAKEEMEVMKQKLRHVCGSCNSNPFGLT